MKKIFLLLAALCFTLSACVLPPIPPIAPQPQPASPVPPLEVDTQATAAISVEQTLQALPTFTPVPSDTPVVATATSTPTQSTPTPTQNPILLTLSATLGTGTVTTGTSTPGTPGTVSVTPNPAMSATPTGTLHYQYYGTMPPNLPFGEITLINRSKAEAYISLQCTTKDGYVTIIEYPVGGKLEINAPAGKYVYVAWVGGNKLVGAFGLDKSQDLTLTIYKDRIEIR